MRIDEQEPPLHPKERNFNKRWEKVLHVGWETVKWGVVGAVVVGLGLAGFAIFSAAGAAGGLMNVAGAILGGGGSAALGVGTALAAGVTAGSIFAWPAVIAAAITGVALTGGGAFAIASGTSAAVASVPAILATILTTGAVVGGIAGAALGAVKGVSGAEDAVDEKLQARIEDYDRRVGKHQRDMLKARQIEAYMQQGNTRVQQQLGHMGISANMNTALPNIKGMSGPNMVGANG